MPATPSSPSRLALALGLAACLWLVWPQGAAAQADQAVVLAPAEAASPATPQDITPQDASSAPAADDGVTTSPEEGAESGPQPAGPEGDEDASCAQQGAKVERVDIEGAGKVSEEAIRQVMRLRGGTWWRPTTWFSKRPTFSDDELDGDLGRIEELYQGAGYYGAAIMPKVTWTAPDSVAVTITIDEGPQTTVSQIALNVTGEEAALWRERLSPLMLLRPGAPFTADLYNRTKAGMAERLLSEGHPKGEVHGDAVVVRDIHQAIVNINVDPGPVGYFGQTAVKGLSQYGEQYVRRELKYQPGQLFDQRKLGETQREIYKLGFFSTALVRPLTSKMEDAQVPVEVDVTERKRYTTRLGVGYGSEDQFRFRAAWSIRGFLGDLRLLTLSAQYSALTAALTAGLQQPHFIDHDTNLNNNVELRRDTLSAYSTEAVRNRFTVDRKLTPQVTVYAGHNLELTHLFNVTRISDVPETTPTDSLISAAELGIARDTTSSPYYPTGGSLLVFAFEEASAALGSEFQYARGVGEGRLYRQLMKDVVLALRLRLGFIVPTETTAAVPIFKRFFTGGTDSVRGYGFQRLGPIDQNNRPIGGNSLTEGNIELRYPVWGKIFGATFVDFGKVSLSQFDYSTEGLRFSAGLGARYQTIVGPVRIDWAYKLNPDPLGEKGRWRLHFSIGQAF